jgi:hypothetical protein
MLAARGTVIVEAIEAIWRIPHKTWDKPVSLNVVTFVEGNCGEAMHPKKCFPLWEEL